MFHSVGWCRFFLSVQDTAPSMVITISDASDKMGGFMEALLFLFFFLFWISPLYKAMVNNTGANH